MKIVIFGLTISSSWGNGHATLWRGLCKALGRLGHRVIFFEHDTPYYAGARDVIDIPGLDLILYSSWETVLLQAQQHCVDADVAIVTSYCADAVAATRLILDAGRPLSVFYDLDTPITLAALRDRESVFYLPPEGLGHFDLVLSYTGGEALRELKERLGARRVLPLYGHVDPDIHRPVGALEHYQAELSYLGTYAADRQAALESLFIAPARHRAAKRFLIGGAQYPADFPWSDNIFFVRHMPPSEHAAFFSSSRWTLNITRRAMAQMGWCPSGRLFEAAACGTAIISDAWAGLDHFFKPQEELLIAHDTNDALVALDLSPSFAKRIGDAARERALAEHTSSHRAAELIDACERVASTTDALALEGGALCATEEGI